MKEGNGEARGWEMEDEKMREENGIGTDVLVLTLRAAWSTPAFTACLHCPVHHLTLHLWGSEINRHIK